MRELVNVLAEMPSEQLPPHLEKFCQQWGRPRGDLCYWIPVLNYFDILLDNLVTKYGLDQGEPTPKLLPQTMNDSQQLY